MTILKSDFLHIFQERGFLHQCTNLSELDALLAKPTTAYIGFDCTAQSLHVGSLIQIMALYWWQQCGHKPIVLMGGGTTKVGDPSGKDESRKLLDDNAISQNMQGIKSVFSNFLRFGENANDAQMVNNADWLDNLEYIPFLRDFGRHFSVNHMLSMDSVKLRLEREQHLSFLEFNYMILQAYDFAKLAQDYNCQLQIGGSDQWGNIVSGAELTRRIGHDKPVFGLTTPLLATSSGAKMGKTADGAVWLNADLFSAYDYWQFWRNSEDADVGRFLRLFTTLPIAEILKLEALKDAEINEAKKILATEATALLHGRSAAEIAAETAHKIFAENNWQAAENMQKILIEAAELTEGKIAAHKLFTLAGLASSGKEARRLIEGGGARIDDQAIADANQLISLGDAALKLSAGKKRHLLVERAN